MQAIGMGLQCVGEEIPQLEHINRCVLGAGKTRFALCLVAISDSRTGCRRTQGYERRQVDHRVGAAAASQDPAQPPALLQHIPGAVFRHRRHRHSEEEQGEEVCAASGACVRTCLGRPRTRKHVCTDACSLDADGPAHGIPSVASRDDCTRPLHDAGCSAARLTREWGCARRQYAQIVRHTGVVGGGPVVPSQAVAFNPSSDVGSLTRATGHIPGYSGHVPKNSAHAASSRATHDKTLIMENFHSHMHGYTGKIPHK